MNSKEFKTDNFIEAKWKQSSDIKIGNERVGVLEVGYLVEKSEAYDGPFQKEERSLIDGITRMLSDIIERKRAEVQIKESLAEKEMLLKEVHHRVKNNMQVISSLLKLQSRDVKDKKIRMLFDESQKRIQLIALVYDKLYQSRDLTSINLKDYLGELTNHLLKSYTGASGRITIKTKGDDIPISVDLAIPCGLIVNELVTNSLKYAFPDGRSGNIRISLRETGDDEIELIISDSGVGIPDNLDLATTKTLGLYLVTDLVKQQLGGQLNLVRTTGTHFRITFKRKQG